MYDGISVCNKDRVIRLEMPSASWDKVAHFQRVRAFVANNKSVQITIWYRLKVNKKIKLCDTVIC